MYRDLKRKLWKITAVTVTVFLTGIVYSNESFGQLPGKGVTITYWDMNPTPIRIRIEKDNIKIFESENPDVKVEYVGIPWEKAHEKYITAIIGGAAPDTAMIHDTWVAEMAAMGALEDLEPYIAKWEHKDDYVPLAYECARLYKNTAYWLTTDLMTSALYYRIDWFKEAGIVDAKGKVKPPTNWDEFLATAKKLTDPQRNRYGFGMRGGRGGERYWLTFMVMRTWGKFFDQEGNCILNKPAPVEALKWYAELYSKHHVTPPTAPTDAYAQMIGAFGSGVTAMYIHNNGSISDQLQSLGEGKFMTAPLPKGPDGYRMSKNMPVGYAVFTQSKNKEAAWKWVSYLAGPVGNSFRCRNIGVLPVNRKVYEEKWLKDSIYSKAFEEELLGDPKYIFMYPAYLPEWAGLCETYFTPEFQKLLLEQQSAQVTADHVAEKLTEAQKKWLKRLK